MTIVLARSRQFLAFASLVGLAVALLFAVNLVSSKKKGPKNDLKIAGVALGDDILDVKRLYPRLSEVQPFAGEWIAPKDENYPIRALGTSHSSVTSLFGYELQIRNQRFTRYDRIEGVLEVLGPASITRGGFYDVYSFKNFCLNIEVDDAKVMFGGFTLFEPSVAGNAAEREGKGGAPRKAVRAGSSQ